MRQMTSRGTAALIGLVLAPVALVLAADAASKPSAASAAGRVERGKYLVTISGCNDCHTPWKMGPNGVPEPDMTRMLSGHPEAMKLPPAPPASGPWVASFAATQTAFAGPWGVTYAINLTPDQNTGIGIWTEEMFIKTLRTGKHFGTSRPIQPPMPWYWMAKATDEDLKSIYAYLRTIPPVVNHVPDYEEPAPAKPAPAKS